MDTQNMQYMRKGTGDVPNGMSQPRTLEGKNPGDASGFPMFKNMGGECDRALH